MSVLGSAVKVALYDEVTYKSKNSVTNGLLAYFTECSVAAQQNNVQPNTISADRSRAKPGAGNLDVSGNLNVEMAPETIGFYLRHILGAPTTTGASAPYTHSFRPKPGHTYTWTVTWTDSGGHVSNAPFAWKDGRNTEKSEGIQAQWSRLLGL